MRPEQIRNFSIIAHIDHGKSTLADRMLEHTKTVEERKMREQVLDAMDLERERGITIKMQPVRMEYEKDGTQYAFHLIDTPGHIDFAYEVSRALKAVEGSILLVDATQGVQAQTFSTLTMAREFDLTIVPVITKIDADHARPQEVKEEIAHLLDRSPDEVFEVSGKTGEGVAELMDALVTHIPPPRATEAEGFRALVFDFDYSTHRGIVVYVRVLDGTVQAKDALTFVQAERAFSPPEVGVFRPEPEARDAIHAGEIGYIVTGVKEPGVAQVGDTITSAKQPLPALAGYREPRAVVWASVYPESQDMFSPLSRALDRIRLGDPSLSFEEESSGALGRGFRCGFLGMLHLEIIMERLRREFGLELVMTTPTTTYKVVYHDDTEELIYTPSHFPDHSEIKTVYEPWVEGTLITPDTYIGPVLQLLYDHEADIGTSESIGVNRTSIAFVMPLRELMRHFFDEVKSATSGFASLSYDIGGMRETEVLRLDVLVAEEPVPAFAKVVSRRRSYEEAQDMVEQLYQVLPRQMFVTKIQGRVGGRIVASRTLPALKKDVTAKLYGGDVTRKMKLREKQKKGKQRMQKQGSVNIPHDVFLKMVKQRKQ